MKDAFGVDRGEISKSLANQPKALLALHRYSNGVTAPMGGSKVPQRVKRARAGVRQVDTPENATRKVVDRMNAQTSATQRDINAWQKSGFRKFPKSRTTR